MEGSICREQKAEDALKITTYNNQIDEKQMQQLK